MKRKTYPPKPETVITTSEINDALEMVGLPIVQFERPSIQLVDTGKGVFKTVTTAGWIKFGIAFRNVMHQLRGAKLAVYMAICLHVNEGGESWPAVRTIALETGYDKVTVSGAILELEKIPGLLEIVRRPGTSNLYRPSFAVYGKHIHTPLENTYTPPSKTHTEVEPLSRTKKEESATSAAPSLSDFGIDRKYPPEEHKRGGNGNALIRGLAKNDSLMSALSQLTGNRLTRLTKTEQGYIQDLREENATPAECQNFSHYWQVVEGWRGQHSKPTLRQVWEKWQSVKEWSPIENKPVSIYDLGTVYR